MAIELVLGIAVAFTVLCYSASFPEQVNFLTSAMVAGSFFYCQLVSYFAPEYKVFVILEYLVVLIGAIVGGVTGILLPVASKGVSIGVLSAIVLNLVITLLLPVFLVWITSYQVYIVCGLSVVGIALSALGDESELDSTKLAKDKRLDWPAKIRSALIVATALTLSVDAVVFDYQVSALVMDVLQLRSLAVPTSMDQYTNLTVLLILWICLLVGSVLFFQYVPGGIDVGSLLHRKRFFSKRSSLPSSSSGDAPKTSGGSGIGGGMRKSRSIANILNSYDLSQSTLSISTSVSFGSANELSERKQRTFEIPIPCAFNFVDEENIPEPLKPFSPMVFSIASSLTVDLGFQLDNARNQSEHLLMMLYNEFELEDDRYSTPAVRLHTKMFQNYHRWCDRMHADSQLLRDVKRDVTSAMIIEDLLIFLLIWGEAANLKHMPECLCFLLHKTLIEYTRVRSVFTTIAGLQGRQQHQHHQQQHQGLRKTSSASQGSSTLSGGSSGGGGGSSSTSSSSTERMGSKKYPGYYLDMIILPLFNVVKKQLGDASADYVKTYDDLNEFFWSPECMQYEIFFSSLIKDVESGGEHAFLKQVMSQSAAGGGTGGSSTTGSLIPEHRDVAVALSRITKTYVEKRSWLHPLLAVNRVFEWHIIAFTLLVSYAFSQYLVWTNTYFLQISSVIFLEMVFFSVLWTCLEVWVKFPYVAMTDAARCGYLLRLSFGYLILCYQAIYYHWSFVEADSTFLEKNWLYAEVGDGNPLFWWWQYNWISLAACSFSFLSALLCWFPSIPTYFMTLNNDLVQAVLSICYPVSQLYVGKTLRATQWETFHYAFFWCTLIIWKLWFGYNFIISSIAVPTMELYDDYMNYLNVSFYRTVVLMAALWSSHFMVFVVDMYIWYSVWSAMWGLAIAIRDRQGDVRSRQSFQSHFMRAPLVFSKYLLPRLSTLNVETSNLLENASTASLTGLLVAPKERKEEVVESKTKPGTFQSMSREDFIKELLRRQNHFGLKKQPAARGGAGGGSSGIEMKFMRKSKSSQDVSSFEASEELYSLLDVEAATTVTAPLEETRDRAATQYSHGVSARLDDINEVRSNRWTIFAQVWNLVIKSMYESDHISEEERDRFSFTYFDWLDKPVYLPLYLSAGCINTAIVAFTETHISYSRATNADEKMLLVEDFLRNKVNPSSKNALEEAWELSVWLLQSVLGSEHGNDFNKVAETLVTWAGNLDLVHSIDANKLLSMVTHLAKIVNCLLATVKTKARMKNPVVTEAVLNQQTQRILVEINANTMVLATQSTSDKTRSSGGDGIKKSVSSGFLTQIAESLQQTDNTGMSGLGGVSASSTSSSEYQKLQPLRERWEIPDKTRDTVRDVLRALFTELRTSLKDAGTALGAEMTKSLTFMMALEKGFFWNDIYASKQLDLLCQRHEDVLSVLQKLKGLLTLRVADAELESPEAKRRLNYFLNSLFMDLPKVPGCRFSKEYTTITPYHSEDIIMSRKDLEAPNHLGISVLLYLQSIHKTDWNNFVKRCKVDTLRMWDKHEMEVRLWASLRGQTLYRTVEGMMQTENAIRLYAELEALSPVEIEVLSKVKFNYVVACQIYGQMVKEGDPKAADINFMMAKWPNLRVAYIDWQRVSPREGDMVYYSVLLKHDPDAVVPAGAPNPSAVDAGGAKESKIREVYRIKLPGLPVLGEGKPENQNHAIIFTRGRFLQAVDMNQAGYFEEALKMRNLLEEFNKGYSILGFKEHIFTGSVSCIANYMAMQELSFVTLGQRVLNNPLRIRQHYGHPDLFNKFFVMTEGGMSKASKGTNLSEDVFAGFNATLRGHTVGFKEYVQVGKGRDVGLQQTYKFEAKLAQGNAEQSLSRDVDRICNRLDFFMLLSFYYGGIGHYISTALVMFTLTIVVYIMLALAIFKQEGVNGRPISPEGPVQLMIAGLGLVQTLPLLVTLTVEKGFGLAVSEVVSMFISGGPLYFIFHIQTKYYYFSQTLMAGGAIYRPTGRGFVVNHSVFDENYRFFASSHIYLGFELFVALILFACYTHSDQYSGLTWPLWLAVASFLLGPFWFNPITFDWDTVKTDYSRFVGWMGEVGGAPDQSWDSWWKDDNAFFDKLSLSWKFYLVFQKCSLWAIIAYGVMGPRFYTHRTEQWLVGRLLALCAIFFGGHHLISRLERQLSYPVRRFAGIFLSGLVGIAMGYTIIMHLHCLRYIVGLYYFASAVCYLLLLAGCRNYVMPLYKCHDYVVAHVIFLMLTVLTALQFDRLQTWLLYHNALSKQDVGVSEVLEHVKQTRARDELKELRTKIATQDLTIESLRKQLNGDSSTTATAAETEMVPLLNAEGQKSMFNSYRAIEPQPSSTSTDGPIVPPPLKPSLKNPNRESGSSQQSPASTPRNRSVGSRGSSFEAMYSAFEKPPSRKGSGASAGIAAAHPSYGNLDVVTETGKNAVPVSSVNSQICVSKAGRADSEDWTQSGIEM